MSCSICGKEKYLFGGKPDDLCQCPQFPSFQMEYMPIDCNVPTLRDKFAMAALPSVLKDVLREFKNSRKTHPEIISIVVARAYMIADAMMAARAKNEKGDG